MENTTRDRLLDVATGLFAAKGFAGVSFAEIAAAAEVDTGLLAEMFGTEEKLYETILEIQFRLYTARMQAALEGNVLPPKKIERMAKAVCELQRESPDFFPLFYRELLNPSQFFDAIVKKHIRHVAYLSDNNIAKGMQKETFKYGINPANATMILLGMFHYYFLASRLHETLLPEPDENNAYCTQALQVFLSGIKKGA